MTSPLPYCYCKLCLSTVTRSSRTADTGRHATVNATDTCEPVMSFRKRAGAGGRLIVPTVDEWAAWKAAVA
jgi:hypothetical protein